MITLGYKGRLIGSSPYDTIINDRKEYEVVTIRPIKDLIASKENPLKRVYLDFNRNEDDMNEDIKNNIHIVVLNDNSGNYAYIPENFIKPYESQIGIKYQEQALVLNLGSFTLDYNFDSYINEIKELTKNKLGVIPKDKIIKTSSEFYLNETESDNLENNRYAIKTNDNLYTRYRKAINKIEELEKNIKKLNGSAIHNINDNLSENAANGNYLLNIGFDTRYINRVDNCNLDFSSKFGVEIKTNNYLLSTLDNELINFEIINDNIIIKNKLTLNKEINSVYNLTNDRFCIFSKEDTNIILSIYDYNFNLISEDTILEDINIIYEDIAIDNINNEIIIGFTDGDNKACVNFINIDDISNITNDIHQISGLHVSDCPLEDKCVFSFTKHKEFGLIKYKDFYKKVKVSDSRNLSVNDDDFKSLHLNRNINMFKTIHEDIYNFISKYNDSIRFDSMNSDGDVLKTTYLENTLLEKSGIIKTIDRSLLILYKNNTRLEIKKIY